MRKLILIACLFIATTAHAIETGSLAPDFSLKSIDGKTVSLKDYAGKAVVLEWFNQGCPFVQKHYKDGDIQALQKACKEKGVVWLTVSSTSSDHGDFLTPEKATAQKAEWKIESSEFLLDPSGAVGNKYGAKTTPHMFIVNAEGKLVYQGAIDDNSSVFSSPKEAKNHVSAALDELLAGKAVMLSETESYGCSIKYAE